MNIVLIGSGNVARVFARLITAKGHKLSGIICRNPAQWDGGLAQLPEIAVFNFDVPLPPADIYIAAVSDSFLPDLNRYVRIETGVIVHTAGSVPAGVLANTGERYGVLYPLQTLRKETLSIPVIPFLIDGVNPATRDIIEKFAHTLSDSVMVADDNLRARMHVAAVSASNFINHLLTLVFDFCKAEGLDEQMLFPLIEETITRLKDFSPHEMQTGPAIRNDTETINRHLEKLAAYPELQKLYSEFSGMIRQYYHH